MEIFRGSCEGFGYRQKWFLSMSGMVGRREWWEARKRRGEEESTVVGDLHRQTLLMLRTSGEVSGRPGVKGLEPRIAQPENGLSSQPLTQP